MRKKVERKMGVRKEKKMKEFFLNHMARNGGFVLFSIRCMIEENYTMTYYYFAKWRDNDREFAARLKFIDDCHKQDVEHKLWELIQMGDRQAIFFYLKCKSGWVERHEITSEIRTIQEVKINYISPTEIKKISEGDKH